MSEPSEAVVELIRAVVREELFARLGEFDSDPCWRVQLLAAREADAVTVDERLELAARELADAFLEYGRAVRAVADEVTTQREPRREWVPVQEAARALGLSPNVVRMRVKRGLLEGRTEGRRVLVRADSVRDAGGELP